MGLATYIGCIPSAAIMKKVLEQAIKKANLWGVDQDLAFPLVIKSGINQNGKNLHYYFNYSDETKVYKYLHNEGLELLTERKVEVGQTMDIEPWGVIIIEEDQVSDERKLGI
jgi:beta-galactosidase